MTREQSPQSIGAKLQEARTRRGVSLSQVAESTKIPVSILQALERNDISHLPGGVVGRGFVRSFASAAGLDPEATVAEFVAQFPLDSVTDGYPAAQRVDENEVSDPRLSEVSSKIHWWEGSTPLRLVAVGVFLAVPVVYIGMPKGWPHWPAMQSRTAMAPAGLASTPVRLGVPHENAVRAAGSSELSVQTQRSDQPSAPSAAADLAVPADVLADSAAARAVPAAGDSPVVSASSPPTSDFASDAPSTNAQSSPDANGGETSGEGTLSHARLTVVLSVTSPSWVIATLDGKKTLNRLIEVGEQERLEARHDLVLTAGDAGAIVMTLNGALAKSLGRPGETITARVSRANFDHYLRP